MLYYINMNLSMVIVTDTFLDVVFYIYIYSWFTRHIHFTLFCHKLHVKTNSVLFEKCIIWK